MNKQSPSTQPQQYNTSDADDSPPPAYEETAAFDSNYQPQSSSAQYQSPPFNPNYVHRSPPHTPDLNNIAQVASPPQPQLYPQVPPSAPYAPVQQYDPQVYPQQQQYVTYQAIQIPYSTAHSDERARLRLIEERRRFPLAAIFFLFGWFCPPLWIFGACCCAGSSNPYEAFWGKVNFTMSMILIVSSIVYSMFSMSQYMM